MMRRLTIRKLLNLVAALGVLALVPAPALAQNQLRDPATNQAVGTYSQEEIFSEGHRFFGGLSQDLAKTMEKAFADQGQPNGYILGEEGGGAFIAGVRYGEGTLYTKNDGSRKVFWQGPSIGLDYGASGSRVMILVYNLNSANDIYRTFGAIEGSAFVVGGAGLTYLQSSPVIAAPVRTGVGLRLGVSAGYLKMTAKPTWNPF